MRLKNLVSVMGLSLALGAAFSLSEPKSGEGASRRGGNGVAGSPEKSGSKRVRRLSRGRFIGDVLCSRREERGSGSSFESVARLEQRFSYGHVIVSLVAK